MRRRYLLGLLGICGLAILTSCSTTPSNAANETNITDEDSLGVTYDVTNTLKVTTAIEDGFTFDSSKGLLKITKSGEYSLEGSLNGYIECDSSLTNKVTLVLNGITITSDHPTISWLSESSKVEIKAKKGTSNKLVTEESSILTNSTVESENNIEFGGKGELVIENHQKHGVSASEIVIKSEINLSLTSKVKDGLHAKQINIESGTVEITAISDGIEAEVNSKGNKGTFQMTGGTLKISKCKNAIKAATSISFSNPKDTDPIGIILRFDTISDTIFASPTVTNTSSVFTYYLDGIEKTI